MANFTIMVGDYNIIDGEFDPFINNIDICNKEGNKNKIPISILKSDLYVDIITLLKEEPNYIIDKVFIENINNSENGSAILMFGDGIIFDNGFIGTIPNDLKDPLDLLYVQLDLDKDNFSTINLEFDLKLIDTNNNLYKFKRIKITFTPEYC